MKYASSSRKGNGLTSKEGHKIKLEHPATFPDKLANDFIQAFTTEGMIVCDPFAGSGTTLCMAKELNRNYIGIEINNEYIEEIIKPRIDKIAN
jgi:site-specific DNA-methyltransferase (adenine-specific)